MSLTRENTQWNDAYCIGDKEIDREFKKLFTIAQDALKIEHISQEQEMVSAIKKIIDELSFYVSTHFVLEQKYMHTLQYPKAEEHTQKHKEIITNLNKFISRLNSLSLNDVKIQLFALIKRDFIDHIIKEDQKIPQWENSLDSFQKSFDWVEDFEIGDEKIDEENKKLFMMTEEAFHQANAQQIDEKIRLIIKYIYAYLKNHFRYEEALMKSFYYPRLAKHVLMHRKIINQINQYVERLPHVKDKHDFEKGLATLMENTLIFHVMDEDAHFRKWYQENKHLYG